MSLCINPHCLQPDHPSNDSNHFCQSCGSELVLQGRYRVMRLLSDRSGFGLVYEAFDRTTPKILKVLKESYSDNEKAVELFQQEAVVLSQLHHSGVPAIEPNGYFQISPRSGFGVLHCIVMEKIDGPNLREWMRQQGNYPISEKQAIQWMRQLAAVLHLVHQHNYFHRDIKPENIMLRSNGQLVLVDFGAAREMTYTYMQQLGKTGGITRISSAGYTPPEQEKGQAVPQSDFYALGCTFIYLLTGKQPTESGMYDSMHNEFHWRSSAPQVSPAFANFIDRLIAAKASDRPKDTQEILTALAEIEQQATGSPLVQATVLQSTDITQIERSPRLQFSRQWLWGGAILFLLAGSSYALWRTVQSQAPADLVAAVTPKEIAAERTLTGHSSLINSVLIASDNKTLISGSADRTIKLWDMATGQELRTLTGHSSFVNSLVLSPDGRTLASSSADRTIKLWDMATGQELRTLTGHTGYVNGLDISPDGNLLASSSSDQTIMIWNLTTGQSIQTLRGHSGFVNSVLISPDGKTLVSGSTDQSIRVWDLATGETLRTLTGHSGFVNAVALSPDGQTIVSSSTDQTIRVWKIATGELVRTLTGHVSFVNPIALSPDGQRIISGGSDGTIKIWNLNTGELLHDITGYGTEIKHFAISPDQQTIASGSGSTVIKLWKLPQ